VPFVHEGLINNVYKLWSNGKYMMELSDEEAEYLANIKQIDSDQIRERLSSVN